MASQTIVTPRLARIADRIWTSRPMTCPRSIGTRGLAITSATASSRLRAEATSPSSRSSECSTTGHALGALIVGRQYAPQQFERLADNRDRRLEGVSVVSAERRRSAAELCKASTILSNSAATGQLRQAVTACGDPAPGPPRGSGGRVRRSDATQPYAVQGGESDHRHEEVDRGRVSTGGVAQ